MQGFRSTHDRFYEKPPRYAEELGDCGAKSQKARRGSRKRRAGAHGFGTGQELWEADLLHYTGIPWLAPQSSSAY